MSTAAARLPAHPARTRPVVVSRPPGYAVLIGVVAVLNLIGLVMVLSASSVASLTSYGSPWHFFVRHLVWTGLGVIAFIVALRLDYRFWRRAVVPLLVISIALLVLVLVPGIGINVAGARRWLGSPGWRFQPTEIAKLAVLVFTADLVARRSGQVSNWRRVLRPALFVLGVFALLVVAQPDLDSTVVLALIVGVVLLVGGIPLRYLAGVGAAGAVTVATLALAAPYRRVRVFTFLDPWGDASNTGYQISQSLIALGSGGWTGVGLGAGRAKWLFLPNAHTDFIFAIIGEELGLFGCLVVVLLFVTFAVMGARTALRAPDRFGTLLAAGLTAWVVGQAAMNIAAVVGLLPVSGIPLPFVSFGGTALVLSMTAAGILANVARQARA
ncbi:MAG: putative lipid II flippase FtsW [Acidimicrobiia bacterium]